MAKKKNEQTNLKRQKLVPTFTCIQKHRN